MMNTELNAQGGIIALVQERLDEVCQRTASIETVMMNTQWQLQHDLSLLVDRLQALCVQSSYCLEEISKMREDIERIPGLGDAGGQWQ